MNNALLSKIFSVCLMLGTALVTTGCEASREIKGTDKDIEKAIQTLAPGATIKQISPSKIAGIKEVTIDGSQGPMVVYADDKGGYLLVGDLLEVSSRRNLTKDRMDELTAIKWESLPLQNAVKVVIGDGSRKLAVFSDADCPYCRKAEQEFTKLNNVTIYTFMYPLPMHPDAARKSKLVWCSADPAKAWMDLMLKGKVPEGNTNCPNPVDENLALGASLGIDGTPAMILQNGKRIPGYVPAERLDAMLNAAAAGK
jgi:thiol:disulfide interchange protein DsbC